ncbi:FecR family protein [Chitinophaga niabensis]|uniref:Ferric-dicitrate binding protein FerR, regulates iron transport through sigma-19 n=1 Tax=Chitinophaga niabensis TaxID=536979 RepID=A0A1N6J223_9BACT|nr:FecR domain-containing protein [Chitinophaga niabensis]SIO38293.1 ferric-dicitrate binding protein FerR, regulates iron transport through sigma-19 [Chitinophaga niabensis]
MTLKKNERREKARLKQEFEDFLQSGDSILPPKRSALLLEKLHNSIIERENTSRRIFKISAKWTAAAAMILLTAGALWLHYNTDRKPTPVTAAVEIKKDLLIVESNKSDSVRRFVLSDSSVVKLAQGSSISYHASFNTGRRDIRLSGKAIFEVRKNAARPFTVYAGNISTTVLGTRFMMNTLLQNKVSVRLFEGKVVIRSAVGTFGMKDVYLKPGEQFVMDNRSRQFTVKSFREPVNNIPLPVQVTDTTSISLEFNQESLGKVLASIGKQYNVEFKFSDDSFNNMLITGKLLPSDSLDVVLSMLGNINGLAFKKVDNNKIEVARIQ